MIGKWIARTWAVILHVRYQSAVQSRSNMAGVLFEDIFNVKDIDPEGKKFDRGEFTLKFARRCSRTLLGILAPDSISVETLRSGRLAHELLDLVDNAGRPEHMM